MHKSPTPLIIESIKYSIFYSKISKWTLHLTPHFNILTLKWSTIYTPSYTFCLTNSISNNNTHTQKNGSKFGSGRKEVLENCSSDVMHVKKRYIKAKNNVDIKLMMKRSKTSSYKAVVQNLMYHFHHHNHNQNRHRTDQVESGNLPFCPPHEDEYYEFSCTSSPKLDMKKHTTIHEEDVVMMNAEVMEAALEMIKGETTSSDNYFCGFGRQLRVTDLPFSVEEMDNHVDEKADEFISKFYRNLRRQSSFSSTL